MSYTLAWEKGHQAHTTVYYGLTQENRSSFHWNQHLVQAAQWHASDMVDRGYRSHIAPEGAIHGYTPEDRILNAGFDLDLTKPVQELIVDRPWTEPMPNDYIKLAYFQGRIGYPTPDIPNLTMGAAWKNETVVILFAVHNIPENNGYLPNFTDPDLLCDVVLPPEWPCPEYDQVAAGWPITCPTVRTYALMEQATAQVIAEGNRYRESRGMVPLTWNDNLAAAAQWHATYLSDNWDTVATEAQSTPEGEVAGGPHGDDVAERAMNAEFYGVVSQVTEFSADRTQNINPMEAFCQMKKSWEAEQDPNQFYMFTANFEYNTPLGDGYIGMGWKNNVFVTVIGRCSQNIETPIQHLYDMPELGDVKTSTVTTDHLGWYLLDGRAINTLPTIQQDNVAALQAAGSLPAGTNLPDAQGAVVGYDSANVGQVTGTDDVTLTTSNLPTDVINANTDTTGAHAHALFNGTMVGDSGFPDGTQTLSGYSTTHTPTGTEYKFSRAPPGSDATQGLSSNTGDHGHTVAFQMNTGAQTSISVKQKQFNVNMFMFLGD